MKYVIISDLHIRSMRKTDRLIDGIPESIYWPIENLRLAANKAKEENAVLVIAGDINDSKNNISQQVITYTLDILEEVSSIVDTYLILGNHDYIVQDNKVLSFLLASRSFPNLNLILPGDPVQVEDMALISYNYDRQGIFEDLMKFDLESLTGIISHFGLTEGQLSGSEYRTGEFSLTRDFINFDKWIILGHYHKPQQVDDKVLYIGSTYPISIAEVFEEKRFILFDSDKQSVESIPTKRPIYKKIEVGDDFIDKHFQRVVEDIVMSGYLTKYILEVDRHYKHLQELKRKLSDLIPTNIHFKMIDKTSISKVKSKQLQDISQFDVKSLINDYLQALGIEDKEDIKRLKNVFELSQTKEWSAK